MIKASRMYRMPENNQEVKRFWAALEVFFFSVCKSPTQSLTFRRTEISWLFLPLFNLFRFILYYFVQAEFFHANLRFQKEKKKLRGNVVFTTTAIRKKHPQFASTLLHLHLYANYCSSAGFRWRQKRRFWIPRWLPFWAPFLFWLSRFYKWSFRLYISTF